MEISLLDAAAKGFLNILQFKVFLAMLAGASIGTFTTLPITIAALLVFCFVAPGLSLAQTPFYQGKTITIVQGRDPGGTGDIRVKAVLPFLQKYIPGNPNILSEYMPGGGSRKAANHIFKRRSPMT